MDVYLSSALAKVTPGTVLLWLALACLTGAFTCLLWKLGRLRRASAILLPLLVFYLAFMLTITLVDRVPARRARYMLRLFWSYRAIASGATGLIAEIFWNVVLFVPPGAMGAALLPRRSWAAVPACFLLSAGIEIAQLMTRRGLFEWDDMVHNILGAAIGLALYLALREAAALKRRKP